MAPKRAQAASQGVVTAKKAKTAKEEPQPLDIEDFGAEEIQQASRTAAARLQRAQDWVRMQLPQLQARCSPDACRRLSPPAAALERRLPLVCSPALLQLRTNLLAWYDENHRCVAC